jgi:hypothetical protein
MAREVPPGKDAVPRAIRPCGGRKSKQKGTLVTAADGTLQGIVSINDIVLAAGGKADVSAADVLDAFKGLCAHRPPLAAKAAGAGAA